MKTIKRTRTRHSRPRRGGRSGRGRRPCRHHGRRGGCGRRPARNARREPRFSGRQPYDRSADSRFPGPQGQPDHRGVGAAVHRPAACTRRSERTPPLQEPHEPDDHRRGGGQAHGARNHGGEGRRGIALHLFFADAIREGGCGEGRRRREQGGPRSDPGQNGHRLHGRRRRGLPRGRGVPQGRRRRRHAAADADVLHEGCRRAAAARRDRRTSRRLRHGRHAARTVPHGQIHHRGAAHADPAGAGGRIPYSGGAHDPHHGTCRRRDLGQHVARERRRFDPSRELYLRGRSKDANRFTRSRATCASSCRASPTPVSRRSLPSWVSARAA